jgi:regulatory protein
MRSKGGRGYANQRSRPCRLGMTMDDLDRCHAAALRILNYRFNSEAELRRKLLAKRFDEETVAATLARLRDERWLDDERFASAYVRTRQQKRIGRLRIKRELQASGVSEEISRRVLSENTDREGERTDLAALCEKRARMMSRRHGEAYLTTPEGRNKLMRYLLNQGYDAALVRSVVEEIKVVDHE